MKKKLIEEKPEQKASTIPDHTFQPTSDPDIFRVCDRNGDWRFYFKKSTNQYAPAVNYIIGSGFNKGPRFMNWLLQQRPEEAQRILEQAGDRGTRVHAAIRDLISGNKVKIDQQYPSELQKGRFEPLTAEEWNCIEGFVNFAGQYKPEVYGQEVVVFSDTHKFAGTIDFLGTIEVPKIGRVPLILDHKTSSGIWDEYALQVAAYWFAYNDRPKTNDFIPAYTAIARYGTKHKAKFEVQIWNEMETIENFQRFLEVKSLHHFTNPGYEKPEIAELPVEFKVNVPIWQPPVSKMVEVSKCCKARILEGGQCENCGAKAELQKKVKKPRASRPAKKTK